MELVVEVVMYVLNVSLVLGDYCRHRGSRRRRTTVLRCDSHRLSSVSFSAARRCAGGCGFVIFGSSVRLVQRRPRRLIDNLSMSSFSIGGGRLLIIASVHVIPRSDVSSM